MLLRIFKANHVIIFLLVPVLGILLLLRSFILGITIPETSSCFTTPICSYLFNSELPSWLAIGLNFIAVMSICLLLLQINASYAFVKERTFLPAFLFILIVYTIPDLRIIHPVLISGIFITLAIVNLLRAYETENAIRPAFNAGFFIGTAGIFYFPANFLIILIPISMIIIRNSVKWRELFVPFIGFILPWIFLFSYYFIIGKTDNLLFLLSNSFMIKDKSFINSWAIQIFGIVLLVITSVASIFILQGYGLKNIDIRRYYTMLFLFFIAMLLLLFLPFVSSEILILIAIPLTFLYTNYFVFVKHKLWAELFLSILLILAFGLQFFM